MSSDSNRITELETKLAYQEQTIDSLDKVVCDQNLELTELKREIYKLNKRIDSFEDEPYLNTEKTQKPPHY